MAITAKDVEELHTYATGVMARADHHAGKVKGIALALLGGIIWRGEPDPFASGASPAAPPTCFG